MVAKLLEHRVLDLEKAQPVAQDGAGARYGVLRTAAVRAHRAVSRAQQLPDTPGAGSHRVCQHMQSVSQPVYQLPRLMPQRHTSWTHFALPPAQTPTSPLMTIRKVPVKLSEQAIDEVLDHLCPEVGSRR